MPLHRDPQHPSYATGLQALWRAGKPVVVGDAESDVEPETDDIVGVPIEKVQVYI